jgi:hypothetical protein
VLTIFLNFKSKFNEQLIKVLDDYGIIFATFVTGIIAGMLIKQHITDRRYYKSIEQRLLDKDKQIDDLKIIVHDRLKSVSIEKKDKNYFRRIMKFFTVTSKS